MAARHSPKGDGGPDVAALKTHEMYYVYLLESVHTTQQRYVGHTDDLKRRYGSITMASPLIPQSIVPGTWSAIMHFRTRN